MIVFEALKQITFDFSLRRLVSPLRHCSLSRFFNYKKANAECATD